MSNGTTTDCGPVCDRVMAMTTPHANTRAHEYILSLVKYEARGWRKGKKTPFRSAWEEVYTSKWSPPSVTALLHRNPDIWKCYILHRSPRDQEQVDLKDRYIDLMVKSTFADLADFYSHEPQLEALQRLVRMLFEGVHKPGTPASKEVDILGSSGKDPCRRIKHDYPKNFRAPTAEELSKQCAKACDEPFLPWAELKRLGLSRLVESRTRDRFGATKIKLHAKDRTRGQPPAARTIRREGLETR